MFKNRFCYISVLALHRPSSKRLYVKTHFKLKNSVLNLPPFSCLNKQPHILFCTPQFIILTSTLSTPSSNSFLYKISGYPKPNPVTSNSYSLFKSSALLLPYYILFSTLRTPTTTTTLFKAICFRSTNSTFTVEST